MANDLNQCTFIGRLGRDPEIKYMPSGDAAVNISIAVGKSWKDKNSGDKKESTTWVPIAFFGKTAEIIGQYCKKGSQVMVTGEFSVRKWTDKEGKDQYHTEIRGNNIQLLGGKPEGTGGQSAAPAQQQRQAQKPAPQDEDDSIPF
jgi:single-strand DNA-binding protein